MARDIRSGSWTEPELDLVSSAVRTGETVVDVGANFGLWTYDLSRAVGPSGRVIAYEPVPFTAATLHRVVRILRLENVEVRAVACGESAGLIELRVPVQHSGAISAGQAHFSARVDDRVGREQHVRWDDDATLSCSVVRLDDELVGRDVSFMKFDVEGAEAFALRGAGELVRASLPTLVLEINPWFLDGFGLEVEDVTGPLVDLGYELFRYERGRLLAMATADIVEDNYVFVHPTRRERLATCFG